MTMLSLFVLSAAVMGFLFLSEPLKLLIESRKQEALVFFAKVVGFFACFVAIFAILLFITSEPNVEPVSNGNEFKKLFETEEFVSETKTLSEVSEECKAELKEQADYLKEEKFSAMYTFDKYKVPVETNLKPIDLDVTSSQSAKNFRTRIREELSLKGINFAGHYSLVGVGMTGAGVHYWIVDRTNGKAYELPYRPYHSDFIDFRKDSNLIILNPKESIRKLLNEQPVPGCYFLNQDKNTDLRPFYFEWKDNALVLLDPKDITPPVSDFWND